MANVVLLSVISTALCAIAFPLVKADITSGCTGDRDAVCVTCSGQSSSQPECCKSIDVDRICQDSSIGVEHKRARFALGKRSIADNDGYGDDIFEDGNSVDGELGESYLNDDFEPDLDAEKRRSPFLGKRRNPFLGKRRSPFLGKRRNPFLGKRYDDQLASRFDKRRMPFLGK
jgi:hypothetical protein